RSSPPLALGDYHAASGTGEVAITGDRGSIDATNPCYAESMGMLRGIVIGLIIELVVAMVGWGVWAAVHHCNGFAMRWSNIRRRRMALATLHVCTARSARCG